MKIYALWKLTIILMVAGFAGLGALLEFLVTGTCRWTSTALIIMAIIGGAIWLIWRIAEKVINAVDWMTRNET